MEAIYENGVFRPLGPVFLPEHQHVTITIRGAAEQPTEAHHRSPDRTEESSEPEAKPWRGVFAPAPGRDTLFTKEFKVRIADLPAWRPFITPHQRQDGDDDT